MNSQPKLSLVARQLNERMRKTLPSGKPTVRFNQRIALTSETDTLNLMYE
ncbi:MAG: hypothetical protein ACJA13_004263 [Paraglaciecola sp.]|jgi:hypothetical protein